MTMKVLLGVVTELTGVSAERIRGPSRLNDVAQARRLVICVAARAMRKTHNLDAIGRELNRNHATICCALKEERCRKDDPKFVQLTDEATAIYVERRAVQREQLRAACHRLAQELAP